jgi:type II secretory pathway pseudopilin PulG
MQKLGVLAMISHNIIKDQNGSTLIEAMAAIVILTIGIFAAMGMQINAVGSSSSALNRTDANNAAIALLETLKELDFDNPNLVETIASPGALVRDANDRTFVAANFPQMLPFFRLPAGAAAGTIVDKSDIVYQLSWDVQDTFLPGGQVLNKVIRIHMQWNSPIGRNNLEMTTVKYNNLSLAI